MRLNQAVLFASFWIAYALLPLSLEAQIKQASTKSLPELIDDVEPAVVVVTTDTSIGSGFLVSTDGIIVTNHHVIDDASSATVRFADGSEFNVEGVLKLDQRRDIAILKTGSQKSKVLTIAKSLPRKGESVYTFGDPLGEFEFSISEGIVSGIRSGAEVGDHDGTWIQTTAPISHGNSGGPLVNSAGDVVGMNTLGSIKGENLNFAVSCIDIADMIASAKSVKAPKALPGANKSEPEPPKVSNEAAISDAMLRSFFDASSNAASGAIAECKAKLEQSYILLQAAEIAEIRPTMRYKKGQGFMIVRREQGVKIYCKDAGGRYEAIDVFDKIIRLLKEHMSDLQDPATGAITAALYYGPELDLSQTRTIGRIEKLTVDRVLGPGEFLASGESKVKLLVRGISTSNLLTGREIPDLVFAYTGISTYKPRGGTEKQVAIVRYLSTDSLTKEYSRLYPQYQPPPKRKQKVIAPPAKPATKIGPSRKWRDKEGKLSVTAKFVRIDGDNVILQPDSGLAIRYPLAKLSAEDQKWVAEYTQ